MFCHDFDLLLETLDDGLESNCLSIRARSVLVPQCSSRSFDWCCRDLAVGRGRVLLINAALAGVATVDF